MWTSKLLGLTETQHKWPRSLLAYRSRFWPQAVNIARTCYKVLASQHLSHCPHPKPLQPLCLASLPRSMSFLHTLQLFWSLGSALNFTPGPLFISPPLFLSSSPCLFLHSRPGLFYWAGSVWNLPDASDCALPHIYNKNLVFNYTWALSCLRFPSKF